MFNRSLLAAACGAAATFLLLHGSAAAATIDVCTGCYHTTIQSGIGAADPGDEVLVHDASEPYRECITIDRSITVRSLNGAAATVIDGAGCPGSSVVSFIAGSESALFQGFTVQNGNAGYGSGGGIRVGAHGPMLAPQILNCVVRNNSAQTGGGIGADDWSSPQIRDCVVEGNTAVQGGGIAAGRDTLVERTIIRGNTATQLGGGFRGFYWSPYLLNCIISGNKVTGTDGYGWGGGVFIPGGTWPRIVNTTISGNTAAQLGGGIHKNGANSAFDPRPLLANSIVWGNAPTELDAADLMVSYSDVQGGYAGTGNLDADPLFADAREASLAPTLDGDYHLASDLSPAVDHADCASAPAVDIDQDARPLGGGCDIGADEVMPSTITITRASYNYLADTLDVEATTPNGAGAALELVGYGPMAWSSRKQHWAISASAATAPASFQVCGPLDGCQVTR